MWWARQDSNLQPAEWKSATQARTRLQPVTGVTRAGWGAIILLSARRRFAFGKYFERRTSPNKPDWSSGARPDRCERQHQALDFAFRFGRAGPTRNIPRTHSTDFPRVEVPSFGSVLPITASRTSSRRWRKPNKTAGFCGGRTRDRTLDLSRVKADEDHGHAAGVEADSDSS